MPSSHISTFHGLTSEESLQMAAGGRSESKHQVPHARRKNATSILFFLKCIENNLLNSFGSYHKLNFLDEVLTAWSSLGT